MNQINKRALFSDESDQYRIPLEVKPGDITERYEELKYCLATRERFECRRLR